MFLANCEGNVPYLHLHDLDNRIRIDRRLVASVYDYFLCLKMIIA